MAKTKHHRDKKRQLGQFLTPDAVAKRILARHHVRPEDRVLEPGFGEGAFLLPLIERFLELRHGNLNAVLTENVWGIELDEDLYSKALETIRQRFGELPDNHHLVRGDFLLASYPTGGPTPSSGPQLFVEDGYFDLIIGNPPFGGTVCIDHQDALERRYGRRSGLKIKKESYSFFIVKSLELVRIGGGIDFICSDTILTIPTMRGLRKTLMSEGCCELTRLDEFSPETSYPMVLLRFTRGVKASAVLVNHHPIPNVEIERTRNLSWHAGGDLGRYFTGPVVGDFLVASSGMTTGKNEYFVREIVDGSILERYEFEFYEDPITLERELKRARLGRLSERIRQIIQSREDRRETRRNVRIKERKSPVRVPLPHPDYRFYNKAQPGIVYAPPRYAIYWKDDGDAVLTFKKNGRWYLHGVGGAPFFGREGVTWRLVSSRLDARFLPRGYVLDSGAPCAFLREGVDREELWFVLGWMLTDTATAIVKRVLNHTMNIQSKDVERLPYPWWVPEERKRAAVGRVGDLVRRAQAGEVFARGHGEVDELQRLYEFAQAGAVEHPDTHVDDGHGRAAILRPPFLSTQTDPCLSPEPGA